MNVYIMIVCVISLILFIITRQIDKTIVDCPEKVSKSLQNLNTTVSMISLVLLTLAISTYICNSRMGQNCGKKIGFSSKNGIIENVILLVLGLLTMIVGIVMMSDAGKIKSCSVSGYVSAIVIIGLVVMGGSGVSIYDEYKRQAGL